MYVPLIDRRSGHSFDVKQASMTLWRADTDCSLPPSGEGGRAQGELCPAGDAGRPGSDPQPRLRGLQDLLPGPAAWGGGSAQGVPPLLLQVTQQTHSIMDEQRGERESHSASVVRKLVLKYNLPAGKKVHVNNTVFLLPFLDTSPMSRSSIQLC